MPAWNANKTWTDADLVDYRQYVSITAPTFKNMTQDCADLSMSLLIDFAESRQLPVTFTNDEHCIYSSTAETATNEYGLLNSSNSNWANWNNKTDFKDAVWKHINVRDLWYHNTAVSKSGAIMPTPGDLLMIYEKGWLLVHRHHCALVYSVYAPGQRHPKEKDWKVPNYPGGERAMKETTVLEYFRGDTLYGREGSPTMSREPDAAWHFDYLNSRGDDKRHAELIYFANARDFARYGFEFRIYTSAVLQ